MKPKERLTNEAITKKFNNQFDLVNYAIGVAEDMIMSGRPARTTLATDNTALQVYDEIVHGKDKFIESDTALTVETKEESIIIKEDESVQETEIAQP